jgi:hypothetical protein
MSESAIFDNLKKTGLKVRTMGKSQAVTLELLPEATGLGENKSSAKLSEKS